MVGGAFASSPSREGEKEKAVVLITGATGFVGSVLLADLLREREKALAAGDGAQQEHQQQLGHYSIDRIVLLLRPSPKHRDVAARLAALRALPIYAPFVASGAFDAAVVAVQGDVSQPRCGLSAGDREMLEGLGACQVCMCSCCSVPCHQ